MNETDEFLEHYGIKGMKWGVRRSRAELDRVAGRAKALRESSKSAKAARATTRYTSGSKDAPRNLTDSELNKRIQRMEAEKRYNSLNSRTVSQGERHVVEALSNAGKKTLQTAASGAAIYVVAKGVERKFGSDAADHVRRGGAKKK